MSDAKFQTDGRLGRPIARGIKEAAAAVGVSPSFIRKAIDAGDLRSTRLGRRVVVKETDLLEWVNRSAREAA